MLCIISPVFSERHMKMLLCFWSIFPDIAAIDLTQENNQELVFIILLQATPSLSQLVL